MSPPGRSRCPASSPCCRSGPNRVRSSCAISSLRPGGCGRSPAVRCAPGSGDTGRATLRVLSGGDLAFVGVEVFFDVARPVSRSALFRRVCWGCWLSGGDPRGLRRWVRGPLWRASVGHRAPVVWTQLARREQGTWTGSAVRRRARRGLFAFGGQAFRTFCRYAGIRTPAVSEALLEISTRREFSSQPDSPVITSLADHLSVKLAATRRRGSAAGGISMAGRPAASRRSRTNSGE